jgi:hypothetical protein
MLVVQQPSRVLHPRVPLGGIMTNLGELIRRVRDPYRPEFHYMRGPGPKCHAKE